jgi:putative membrane protein
MPDNYDPRVFFAAERTLLAWVRTGLGLIGLGFVVARFGLFLKVIEKQTGEALGHHISPWVGVSLALLGSAACGVAAWQHRRFCRTLGVRDLPPGSCWWRCWWCEVMSTAADEAPRWRTTRGTSCRTPSRTSSAVTGTCSIASSEIACDTWAFRQV